MYWLWITSRGQEHVRFCCPAGNCEDETRIDERQHARVIGAGNTNERSDREHAGERLTGVVADRATERDLDTQTAVTRGVAHETITRVCRDVRY